MYEFLSELQSVYEKIALNQIGRLEQGLSQTAVIERCRKVVDDMRFQHENVDRILNEHLRPMLNNIKDITDEEESVIFTTVQKISSYEIRLDPGLAATIYQSLLERARDKNDMDKTVKYLYWCGVTIFYLSSNERGEYMTYFEEGSSYADKYFEIENPETRRYIHRCMGNRIMVLYSLRDSDTANVLLKKTFSFWNKIIFRGKDADFPWLTLFIACLGYQHRYVTRNLYTVPINITKEECYEILDVSMTMHRLLLKNKGPFNQFGDVRYEWHLWNGQFITDMISFEQLCGNVFKCQERFAEGDCSADALYANIQMYAFLLYYAANMPQLAYLKDDFIARSIEKVMNYVSSIPATANERDITATLNTFITNLKSVLEPMEHLDFVLKMTTYRHMPTYAHSMMVGKTAVCLTEHLLKKSPELFIGCLDLETLDDVLAGKNKLYEFAYTSGLCHDIGRISFASNPFMLTRTLTETDKRIVQKHPQDGCSILTRKNGSAHSCYNDVILGHHKHYDNIGGYPEDFDITASKHRMMVDIIHAADQIDITTDDIGLAQTDAKSLEEIIEEIRRGAGKEYHPAIAELLSDAEVVDSLRNILTVEREETYYKAYTYAWS